MIQKNFNKSWLIDQIAKYLIDGINIKWDWGKLECKTIVTFELYSIFMITKLIVCMNNWLTNFMHNTETWFVYCWQVLSAHYMWLSVIRIKMSVRNAHKEKLLAKNAMLIQYLKFNPFQQVCFAYENIIKHFELVSAAIMYDRYA